MSFKEKWFGLHFGIRIVLYLFSIVIVIVVMNLIGKDSDPVDEAYKSRDLWLIGGTIIGTLWLFFFKRKSKKVK